MKKRLTLQLGKGINRDQLPMELAPGFWNDCQNMRFRNGCDERVGGMAAVFNTPSNVPYGVELFDVGTTAGSVRYLVEVGIAKVHVDDGTTRTEITRGLSGTMSSISGGGVTVTVTTSANHGLSTGDNVIIGNVLPSGYNTGNAGASITVTGATTFTYANATAAASTQLGYWDSNRTSDFTAAAGEEISICVVNGVLYVNTLLDGCYYWQGSVASGAQGRLRRVRVSTASNNVIYARTARGYKDYLVLPQYLGIGLSAGSFPTSSAAPKKPYDFGWGASADPSSVPSSFAAASSNDAGAVQKPRGAMVDGLQFGETFYCFQEKGCIAVDWIGGNDVFSFRTLEGSDGLLAPNCIANSPAGQVFLSQNLDVKIHTGGPAKSIAEGRILKWLRDNIDSTYYARSFLRPNHRFGEIWVCIPTTGNSTCNKALIWNYNDDTWGERDLSGVTCGASGMLPTTVATTERLVLGTTTPRIALADSGTTDFGSSFTSMVERIGMNLGDPDTVKNLQGTRWHDDGTAGATASVYHGSSMISDVAPTYTSAATHTVGTSNWVNTIATGGREIAIKRTTTAEIGKCRSLDVEYTTGGPF